MKLELEASGTSANFVMVNKIDAESSIDALIGQTTSPILQDVAAVEAWKAMGGTKDDLYIYDAAGLLVARLPVNGLVETNLSTPEGYTAVKDHIVAASQ